MKTLAIVGLCLLLGGCGHEDQVKEALHRGAELTRAGCEIALKNPALDHRVRVACELILAAPPLPAPS